MIIINNLFFILLYRTVQSEGSVSNAKVQLMFKSSGKSIWRSEQSGWFSIVGPL